MHFDMKNYINSEEFGMQLLYRILKLYMHAVVYKKYYLGTGKNSLLQWKSYRCNFLLQAHSLFKPMSCKCIADKFKRRVEVSVAGLDSWFFLFWGGGCKILWVLLTHLEAFLSKDFLVEEHTAKCVISDTSPVPSSTGLNLCSLSCIPLFRDMKKIMSYFSFISPHTPFSLMCQHISSNWLSLSVDIGYL